MTRLLALCGCALGVASLLASAGRPAAPAKNDDIGVGVGVVKGITVSTPRGGRDWGSDAMVGTIGEIRSLGSNWIAIHPYGGIERDGRVSWRRRDGDTTEAPVWLTRPIAEAHRQGMKILIKPHLAHWRSGFAWRGEIAFDSEADWDRFFSTYTAWIADVARFSRGADAFAVGTELDRTVGVLDAGHAARWRAIISAVREVFPGVLTYAANWTDYERVPFWDAVDLVGIQAYFPVVTDAKRRDERLAPADAELEAGWQDILRRNWTDYERVPFWDAVDLVGIQAYFPVVTDAKRRDERLAPADAELEAGWQDILRRMRRFSRRVGQPILFTELAYNNAASAPYEPWDDEGGGADAETLQERLLTIALRAVASEPSIRGAFLWKWFPGERQPRNFAMSRPALRQIISRQWGGAAQPN